MLSELPTRDKHDAAGLSLDELEHELASWVAHLSAGMCRWLELVAELDGRGAWADSGLGSCAEWLAWRCALAPRAAREHVRVARRLPELPLIQAAFSRGELSYAKVRALTRVAEPGSEGELLELAFALTAAQLERAVRAYRRVSAQDARALHEREQLTWYWDEDGSLVVRARLAPEDGALLLRALEASRERLWRGGTDGEHGSAEPREEDSEHRGEDEGGSAEPRPRSVRPTNIEALVSMADAALASEGGRPGGERYQVVVHVDETVLGGGDGCGAVLEGGPAVAADTARRIACDASVTRTAQRQGGPPSVGRKARTIPPALRRALTLRDRGCRFPGCENHRFVDAHHIHHWARGGATVLDNLVLLCRRHHRLVHEGGFGVDARGRFYDARGRRIAPTPGPHRGCAGELLERNQGLTITARTCKSGDGDPLDLELAVAALCQIAA
ncbi:MAG: DUF222 domain-containing protein [Thermoleophilia bacterium]|nr:DUF222 domain-containing protein [Thermoleophilia bacterium]